MSTGNTPAPTSSYPDLVRLVKEGKTDTQIREALSAQYDEDYLVLKLMTEVKKLRQARNSATGLIFICVGAALLLLGFAFTLMKFYEGESINFFLYGMTIVGICVVFYGLVKIFG